MKALVWAHRGASAYAPENTLESFELAMKMGADGVELDVHLTADGELAVSHDGKIDRTSNGSGEIKNMTLAELRKFDFAAGFADKYKNVKLPTLAEVFDLLRPSGMTVNVELKAGGAEYLAKALACEDDLGMRGRVVYSSFDHFNLTRILALRPDAFVAPLYGSGLVKPWDYAAAIGAKAVHPHLSQLFLPENEGYADKCHALGLRVHPWTVDSENDLARVIAAGADAVITNRPDVALLAACRQ